MPVVCRCVWWGGGHLTVKKGGVKGGSNAVDGTANTGGGGGGACQGTAGEGGSGIVVIRYKYTP